MFQKSHHEAGIFSYGSLMLTSNMNQSGVEHSFARARRLSAARANRSMNGGMFSRGTRAYRHI